ncbi:hypothetical protein [Muricoccus nepalensis]|uniref:hypothetical protein n=1 Tax=Muricoccus nepalensis TaxID=1854500 RepID=UPI00112E7421|nr:hypothetical protein [Roseomonas nepalensis]
MTADDPKVDQEALDPGQYAPGSFGCHEAFHMAFVCAELVGERLCEHPAVLARPEWKALADRAAEALHDLYVAIGTDHLVDDR